MCGDLRIDERLPKGSQLHMCAFLVATHQPAVAGDIRRQHSRQSSFHALAGQKNSFGSVKSLFLYQSIGGGLSARYNVREWAIRRSTVATAETGLTSTQIQRGAAGAQYFSSQTSQCWEGRNGPEIPKHRRNNRQYAGCADQSFGAGGRESFRKN